MTEAIRYTVVMFCTIFFCQFGGNSHDPLCYKTVFRETEKKSNLSLDISIIYHEKMYHGISAMYLGILAMYHRRKLIMGSFYIYHFYHKRRLWNRNVWSDTSVCGWRFECFRILSKSWRNVSSFLVIDAD